MTLLCKTEITVRNSTQNEIPRFSGDPSIQWGRRDPRMTTLNHQRQGGKNSLTSGDLCDVD